MHENTCCKFYCAFLSKIVFLKKSALLIKLLKWQSEYERIYKKDSKQKFNIYLFINNEAFRECFTSSIKKLNSNLESPFSIKLLKNI